MENTEDREFLTPSEVRDRLRISSSAVYSLIGTEIPGFYLGRSVRVKTADVEAYLSSKRVPESTGDFEDSRENGWWRDVDEDLKEQGWWKHDEDDERSLDQAGDER